MADGGDGDGLSAHDWMLEQVVGEGPSLAVSAERPTGEGLSAEQTTDAVDHHDGRGVLDDPPVQRGRDVRGARPHELDDLPAGESTSEECGLDINSGAKRAAVWLGSGVLLVAVLIVAAFVVFGGGQEPVAPAQHHALAPAVSAAPITANQPVPQQDHVVPFTAHTDSCTPAGGSADQLAAHSPQALTDTGTDSAWVCGRGPQESLLDGQVLRVQFICDPSRPGSAGGYMLTSVSVTPGWVAKTPAGKDEWLQHRVVTRLQFNFFNGNQLVADPFFLDTRSIHGPVPASLPAKILASHVDVIILHTERPPAAPLAASTGPSRGADVTELQPPGGLVDSVVGPGTAQPAAAAPGDPAGGGTAGDPVDATFAMSQLQFLGHSPI